MKNKLHTVIYGTIIASNIAATAAHANGNFYALGDSLSDNGNLLRDFGENGAIGAEPAIIALLESQAAQGYAGGRATNGPTWAEYLPGLVGLSSETEDNYAYGGATTGVAGLVDEAFLTNTGAATGFLTQISQLQANVPRLSSDDVIGVRIGTNDVHPAAAAGIDPNITSEIALANITTGLNAIADLGGENVILVGLYDLAELNTAAFGPAYDNYDNTIATQTSQQINTGLQTIEIEGVNIHYLDVFTLLQRVQADPAANGYISAVSSNACVDNDCGSLTLEEQNQFVWIDGIHFTTRFEETIGQYASKIISAGNISALNAESSLSVIDDFQQVLLTSSAQVDRWYEKDDYRWFITPRFSSNESKSDGLGTDEAKSDLSSITVGANFPLSEHLRLGAAINFSHNDTDLSADFGDNQVNALQASTFINYQANDLFFDAGFTATAGAMELTRTGVFDDLEASPNILGLGLFAQTGKLFRTGGNGYRVGPVASLRYADLTVGDYVESGDSLLTIGVDEQDLEQTTAALGIRLESPLLSRERLKYQIQLDAENQSSDDRDLRYYQTNVPNRGLVERIDSDDDTYARLSGSIEYKVGLETSIQISGSFTDGRENGDQQSIHASFNMNF